MGGVGPVRVVWAGPGVIAGVLAGCGWGGPAWCGAGLVLLWGCGWGVGLAACVGVFAGCGVFVCGWGRGCCGGVGWWWGGCFRCVVGGGDRV